MPPIALVLQLLQVLATALLLVQFAHVLRLALGQLQLGHGVLVLEAHRRLVVDVDVALHVAARRFCCGTEDGRNFGGWYGVSMWCEHWHVNRARVSFPCLQNRWFYVCSMINTMLNNNC